jgi:heat shock protein HslJ
MPTAATFVLTEDRVTGRAFCNSYEGGYSADGDDFAVGDLSLTEAACVDSGVMAAEQAYVTALTSVRTAEVTDGLLVLSGAGVTLRFARQVPEPDRELMATHWVLDTLVDGQSASSTVAGTQAVLVLAPDGTLTGSTGCRDLAGTWVDDDGQLRLTGLPTDTCTGQAAGQDATVLAVLAAGPTTTVDGDRLTLSAADGRGLVYRAT